MFSSLFGGSTDVKCEIVDSPSGTGKSIMSEPIDEVAVSCTPDKFIETLEKDWRSPPDLGLLGSMVATVDLKETPCEDGQFIVVISVSTPMGGNKVAAKIKVDNEAGIVSRQNYLDPENIADSTLDQTRTFKIHREPFRVECWVDQLEVRDASSALNGTITWVFNGLMDEAGVAHVKITDSADSPSSPGLKSLLSDPLDGIITKEKFWEVWESYLRAHKDMAPGLNTTLEITDLADGFSEIQVGPEGQKIRFRKHVKDLGAGTWSIHRYKDEAMTEKYDTFELKLHESPLVAEMWVQKLPGRLADVEELTAFSGRINQIIQKAQPGWLG